MVKHPKPTTIIGSSTLIAQTRLTNAKLLASRIIAAGLRGQSRPLSSFDIDALKTLIDELDFDFSSAAEVARDYNRYYFARLVHEAGSGDFKDDIDSVIADARSLLQGAVFHDPAAQRLVDRFTTIVDF